LAGLVVGSLASLSVVTSYAQEKVIRIGALLPASGRWIVFFGVQGKQAQMLALEELNKTGVNGYKFVINYEDSQCSPLAATNAAKRMLENFKPHIVIGEECS
jgi:branched-chain amino acid transport system substrate-binding protein